MMSSCWAGRCIGCRSCSRWRRLAREIGSLQLLQVRRLLRDVAVAKLLCSSSDSTTQLAQNER
jgi:hypothetical protein